ncbi:squalene-hopene-cyclase [Patellaria atrata CBS 101060]|uniref:Terpene cyclase/mutase family member n=1 Tax=Patellaria atrata CBS 101060 TaxID=1346257 RepID=A0A9P4VN51_9PEZI|nr:squalene-hopene-cyclase [Patellaria atrata CBS 101060]
MIKGDGSTIGRADFSDTTEAREYKTDLTRWRLRVENGRHMWTYLSDDEASEEPQSFLEKYWLGLPFEMPTLPRAQRPLQAIENGWEFFKRLQAQDGHWGCNDDGPLFVTSAIVIVNFIMGNSFEPHMRREMCRYLMNVSNEDGGWGLFIQSPSTVFGTVMNYITLRILGVSPKHSVLTKARSALTRMGGILTTPTWGKFWLCVLGVYEWDGMTPLPPELLLTPSMLPLSPGQWWVHTRNVFISMSYFYGHKFVMQLNDLTRDLRRELYDRPYEHIDWPAQRNNISKFDRLAPITFTQRTVATMLQIHERLRLPFLRRWALEEALFQIEAEVRNTNYLCIAPVSFASNMLAMFHAHGPDSHWVRGMRERIIDPMWMCREGLAASGTNGTSLWDTVFTLQATIDSEIAIHPENSEILRTALEFIDNTQIRENPLGLNRVYRQATKGGWPFSTRDQSYVVSDTTAEAVKVVVLLQQAQLVPKLISDERLKQAVDLVLKMENNGGGYSAYEPIRGPLCLELMNITELYENVMTDQLYPECTGSVMTSLTTFAKAYPDYRTNDIQNCIDRCVNYLLSAQYPNGGWFASWGVCFTYATMFALQGLASVDVSERISVACKSACNFLLSHQNPDGGWGESLESARTKQYVQDPAGSQVTNTSYAVIGLMAANCTNHMAIKRGIAYLMEQQQQTGDWLPGALEGVFAPPGGMRYPNYKFHFTLSALGRFAKLYGNEQLLY